VWNITNKISGGGGSKIRVSGDEENINRWKAQFPNINREETEANPS
jgi:hypothetical protein